MLGATFDFRNSIIAGNRESALLTSFFIQVPGDCAGTLTPQAFNIVSTPNCTINRAFTQTDPLLGPEYNGGPTQTHALLSGSPAIDAGETPNCTINLVPIITDQRGNHRPAYRGKAYAATSGPLSCILSDNSYHWYCVDEKMAPLAGLRLL